MITAKGNWLDILSPTKEDVAWLRKYFPFHRLVLQELQVPSARARVDATEQYLYLIFYFPVYDAKEQTSRRAEIDFLITKSHVITAHYENIKPFEELKLEDITGSLELCHALISTLIAFENRQLRHIHDEVENIGMRLFQSQEKSVLQDISREKRNISEYRIVVKHQGPLLESLLTRGKTFWGADTEIYMNDLLGDHLRLTNQLENYREAISDFEDTNNQLMNLKINSAMKTFTILSFLTFPFVLLATVFGMQVSGNPFLHMPHAFWILLGLIAVGLISLFIYFVRKEWL